MEVSKKITKSGAVTLPRMIRQETGILPGVPVDIRTDAEGVHIVKHVPACRFCGTVDEVKTVLGMLQILKAADWKGTPQEAVDVIRAAVIVDEGLKVTVEQEKEN